MGVLQNQNLTRDLSQSEVTEWEFMLHESSTVNNSIVVLGTMTFALQLCLVLFLLVRCWKRDDQIRESLNHPDTVKKLIAPSSLQADIHQKVSYQLCDNAASPPASSAAFQYERITTPLFGPSIPWDLVQA